MLFPYFKKILVHSRSWWQHDFLLDSNKYLHPSPLKTTVKMPQDCSLGVSVFFNVFKSTSKYLYSNT